MYFGVLQRSERVVDAHWLRITTLGATTVKQLQFGWSLGTKIIKGQKVSLGWNKKCNLQESKTIKKCCPVKLS